MVEPRFSRAVWIERVQRFTDSGLTVKAFCAANGLKPEALSVWKCRLRRQAAAVGTVEPGAKPIEDHVVESTNGCLELFIGDAYVVRLSRGFDTKALRKLLDVVESRASRQAPRTQATRATKRRRHRRSQTNGAAAQPVQ